MGAEVPPARSVGRGDRSRLIGRSAELAMACSLVDEVADGAGRAVFLLGEGGIGKSRLADEVMAQALRRDLPVVSAGAHELEGRRPFGPLVEAFGIRRGVGTGPVAELAGLLFEPRPPGDRVDLEHLVSEGFLELVEERCAAGGLVLAVEDLHWADPATLTVLHRLARSIPQIRLLLLLTSRPVEAGSSVDRLMGALQADLAARIELEPLGDVEVAELVEHLLQAPPGPNLLRQAGRAAGNPLYVIELVQALRMDGSLGGFLAGEEVVDLERPEAAVSLSLTVLHRASVLSREALEVLRVAAVLGERFGVGDLSAVLQRPSADLLPVLDEAVRAGLLVEAGSTLAFRHDLIRHALYDDLSASACSALHLDVARALARAGAPPERVADHFARGASRGDGEAVEWIQRAAGAVAPRSPDVAAGLLGRAMELAGPGDSEYHLMAGQRVLMLMWSGQLPVAEPLAREVLGEVDDPALEGTLRLSLVQSMIGTGRGAEAAVEAETGGRDERLPLPLRAHLLAQGGFARAHAGDLAGAEALADEAMAIGERAGDPASRAFGLTARCMVAGIRGDMETAVDLGRRAVDAADADATGEAHRLHPNGMLGEALVLGDRFEEAERVFRAGLALADRSFRPIVPGYHCALGHLHLCAGDWDAAVVEVETAAAVADDTGSRVAMVWGQSMLAQIALRRDDLEAARRALARADDLLASTPGVYRPDWLLWTRALLLDAEGEVDQAAALLGSLWDMTTMIGAGAAVLEHGLDVVRLALATGDRERASGAVEGIDKAAAGVGSASARGVALQARGLLEEEPPILMEAVDVLRSSPRPRQLASALEDAAEGLARADQPKQAGQVLPEALGIFDRLGAVRDSARAESRLRALGVRVGSRGPRGRPAFGWDALTPTEVRVAKLVAEGLTNPRIAERLFVSRYTVQTHVSHILAKLGAASRVELILEAAHRPPAPRTAR